MMEVEDILKEYAAADKIAEEIISEKHRVSIFHAFKLLL